MVPVSTIITACITLFITLILPIIVYIIYGMKNKGKGVWLAWLLGAAGFFVFQIIIRSPIISVLSVLPGFMSFVTKHYLLYCFILAFTAALFEVTGRYIVARIMSKDMTAVKSFSAGLGHGSIEAIFIVGMTYINNLIYIAMINTGAFDGMMEQTAAMGVDISQLSAIKESLISTNSSVFLLAGYERILTVIFHIALSMTVCYFVKQKKDIVGILICLVCHWTVDFVAPVVNGLATEYLGNAISQSIAYIIVYAFLTIVALLAIVDIRYLWKKWRL